MTLLILFLGMVCASFAPIFIKTGTLDPIILTSYRLVFAGIALLPFYIRELKKSSQKFSYDLIKPSLLPGLFLAFHFVFFISGARLIPGSHSTVLVTMSPIMMPFVMFFFIREKITKIEVIGSALGNSGVFFLGMKDSQSGSGYILGDILVITSVLFLTVYLGLARKHRNNSGFWTYIVPLYFSGAVVAFIISIICGEDIIPRGGADWISILGLALVCTVGGHSANNYGMRKMRGQIISLINLSQILFTTLMSFIFLGEIPPLYFYPAALIILSGPLVVILSTMRTSQNSTEES